MRVCDKCIILMAENAIARLCRGLGDKERHKHCFLWSNCFKYFNINWSIIFLILSKGQLCTLVGGHWSFGRIRVHVKIKKECPIQAQSLHKFHTLYSHASLAAYMIHSSQTLTLISDMNTFIYMYSLYFFYSLLA